MIERSIPFKHQLTQQIKTLQKLLDSEKLQNALEQSINWMTIRLRQGLSILIYGKLGSSADLIPISCEMVGRFLLKCKALNVICLNTNVSVLTTCENDIDYSSAFARQVESHAHAGNECSVISISGNSSNVF